MTSVCLATQRWQPSKATHDVAHDVTFEGGVSLLVMSQTQQGLNSSMIVRFGRFKWQNPLIEGLLTTWVT